MDISELLLTEEEMAVRALNESQDSSEAEDPEGVSLDPADQPDSSEADNSERSVLDPVDHPGDYVQEDDHYSGIVKETSQDEELPNVADDDKGTAPVTGLSDDYRSEAGKDFTATEEAAEKNPDDVVSLFTPGDAKEDDHSSTIGEQVPDSETDEKIAEGHHREIGGQISDQGDNKEVAAAKPVSCVHPAGDASIASKYSGISQPTQDNLTPDETSLSCTPSLDTGPDGMSKRDDDTRDPSDALLSQTASLIPSSVAGDMLDTNLASTSKPEDTSSAVAIQDSCSGPELSASELASRGDRNSGTVSPDIMEELTRCDSPSAAFELVPQISEPSNVGREAHSINLPSEIQAVIGDDKVNRLGKFDQEKSSMSDHQSLGCKPSDKAIGSPDIGTNSSSGLPHDDRTPTEGGDSMPPSSKDPAGVSGSSVDCPRSSLPPASEASNKDTETCYSEDVSHYIHVSEANAGDHIFQYEDYLDALSEQNFDVDMEPHTKGEKANVASQGNVQIENFPSQMVPCLPGNMPQETFDVLQQNTGNMTHVPVSVQGLQDLPGMSQDVHSAQQEMASIPSLMTTVSQEMASLPHEVSSVHQAVSSVPQGMTFLPQQITSLPQQVTPVSQEMAIASHELSNALQETLDALEHEIPVSLQEIPVSLQDIPTGLQVTHGIEYPQTSFAVQVSANELLDFQVATQVTPAMFHGMDEPMQDTPLDYSMKTLRATSKQGKRKAVDDDANCASPAKVHKGSNDLSVSGLGEPMDLTCVQVAPMPTSLHSGGLRTAASKVGKVDACSQTTVQQATFSNGESKIGDIMRSNNTSSMSTINLKDISSEADDVTGRGDTHKEGMSEKKDQTKKRILFIPTSTLREVDVGICTYIGDHKGFSGIIKERYEDFVVHEINEAHQVIHLTDFSCPPEEKEAQIDVTGILSAGDGEVLSKLQDSEDKGGEHLIDVTSASKEVRTKIHMAIRQNYTNLESNTTEKEEIKYIKVTKKPKGGKSRVCKWPKNRPKYCRFVLNKENIDTNEALSLMAKYLRIRPHAFQYAGTKDKRAVTVQEMTIQKFDAKKLSKLNEQLRGIRLGNFRYVEKPLSLGELSGNHFEIILREVKGDTIEIEKALNSLKENGFVNYFGMQRFGNTSVPTHHIGRAVLKNQWEEAIDLILLPKPGDDSDWRQHWAKTRDAKSTLSRMPHTRRLSLEKQILKSLSSTKNNYCQAFASIPRNARMLYLHSFQSRVWNTVATRRIPSRGVSVNAGDLVARKSANNENASWICPERVGEDMVHKYSSEDIVLPLPGHSVNYPDNEASIYKEILAEDGITMDHMKHKVKDYSLPGAYRKLIVVPRNVTWSFIKYDDNKIKLIQSDLDRMEGITEPVQQEDGSKLALKVSFSLPTSAYATMALRELMKTETASAHHAAMTQENRKEEEGR